MQPEVYCLKNVADGTGKYSSFYRYRLHPEVSGWADLISFSKRIYLHPDNYRDQQLYWASVPAETGPNVTGNPPEQQEQQQK
jgi:hypothetical protein